MEYNTQNHRVYGRVQWLWSAISNGPNRVGLSRSLSHSTISWKMEADPVSESRILDKDQKPSDSDDMLMTLREQTIPTGL
jgi:hypothetical protein